MSSRQDIARQALERAAAVRDTLGVAASSAINPVDACSRLDPEVRVIFVDFSMEGSYLRGKRPLIKISSLRPLARRTFNVAHELGHHIFGHASRIDELRDELERKVAKPPEEQLADDFASHLLMPRIGLRRAFNTRGWNIKQPTATQAFVVACHFGVGYTTLLNHLAYGIKEVPIGITEPLMKCRLNSLRSTLLLGAEKHQVERLFVADAHYEFPTIDIEVGTHVLLPNSTEAENTLSVSPVADLASGSLFVVDRPGITRAESTSGWSVIIRASRHRYAGWAKYRHLDGGDDDDE